MKIKKDILLVSTFLHTYSISKYPWLNKKKKIAQLAFILKYGVCTKRGTWWKCGEEEGKRQKFRSRCTSFRRFSLIIRLWRNTWASTSRTFFFWWLQNMKFSMSECVYISFHLKWWHYETRKENVIMFTWDDKMAPATLSELYIFISFTLNLASKIWLRSVTARN